MPFLLVMALHHIDAYNVIAFLHRHGYTTRALLIDNIGYFIKANQNVPVDIILQLEQIGIPVIIMTPFRNYDIGRDVSTQTE